MPDPSNYADRDSFLEACIPMMIDEGRDQDQAVAACNQMWRDKAVPVKGTWNNEGATLTFAPDSGEIQNWQIGKNAAPTVDRAWSVLTIKSVNTELREIEGIASTPTVDRMGDIVESLGAQFTLPMPLLHHHRHDQPVGHVVAAKAGKDGITIKARLAQITEPGPVKDRVDTAWQELKAGLVRGLSIGFKPLEYEALKEGGLRFLKWSWYELSLVTIPAQADAQISLIKSLDTDCLAASGNGQIGSATDGAQAASSARPGASGKSSVNLKLTERSMSRTITEQREALEAKLAANMSRMEAVMAKAMEEGRSTDEAEAEEFDNLQAEVSTIESDLKRFRALEKSMKAKATPVDAVKSAQDASDARGGASYIRVQGVQLPPGIAFARVVRCIAQTNGDYERAIVLAEKSYPDHPEISRLLQVKAAVAAGTTTDSVWAGALVSSEGAPFADFLEYLRPQTIMGKFGTNGIPDLDRVPFRVPLGSQTSGGAGYWVGEAQAKPLTRFDFARTTLLPLKVANICVVSKELIKYSGIAVETRLRNELVQALRARMDVDFIDPASAATQFRPASITNGATLVTSAGASADNVRLDINSAMQTFLTANNPPETGVWVMSPNTALSTSMITNAFGQQEEFARGLSVNGGTFAGMPVITSNHVGEAGSPLGKYVWLINARDIWLGDEGGFDVAMSSEASLEMSDTPTHAAGGIGSPEASGGTSLVSMFQTNSVALLAERVVNWAKARTTAVVGITGVTWGQ